MIELKINGRSFSTNPGTTVLEAALAHGSVEALREGDRTAHQRHALRERRREQPVLEHLDDGRVCEQSLEFFSLYLHGE